MIGANAFGWVYPGGLWPLAGAATVVLGEDSPLRARLVVKRVVVAVIGDGYAPGARLEA